MHDTTRRHDGVETTRSLTGGLLKRTLLLTSLIFGLAAVGSTFAAAAQADTVGPITFEPPTYLPGTINGQNGWLKTGAYDVAVTNVLAFPSASGYGFGTQALRVSDAVTSGSFGDQTFSPGLLSPAGESLAKPHFEASFRLGTTQAGLQAGLHMSVSPDNGTGARMSYLRFEDQLDGVHVFFDDVTDPGPVGTVATFNETDIATLSRTRAHSIRFAIDFRSGPGNDVVTIFIDGKKRATGSTWENYYRFDPEQSATGNQVPTVAKLLFRESGTANPLHAGGGFLVDRVKLASSNSDGRDENGNNNNSDGGDNSADQGN